MAGVTAAAVPTGLNNRIKVEVRMSKFMPGGVPAAMLLAVMASFAAPPALAQVKSDRLMFFKPYKQSETEIMQRATSAAIGNLAWESVTVSAVTKVKGQVKWTATTRSNRYFCTADPDGQNSACDRP